MIFFINGIYWQLKYVPDDSVLLVDRTGNKTVACTDPLLKRIYISNKITGAFMRKVLMHELCHCVLFSYNLLDDIHMMTKSEYTIDMEEFICNIIAEYSIEISVITDKLLKVDLH